MSAPVPEIKWTRATWLGRRGRTAAILLRGGPTGLRVSLHQWANETRVEFKVCEGDGRDASFLVHETVSIDLNPAAPDTWTKSIADTAAGLVSKWTERTGS